MNWPDLECSFLLEIEIKNRKGCWILFKRFLCLCKLDRVSTFHNECKKKSLLRFTEDAWKCRRNVWVKFNNLYRFFLNFKKKWILKIYPINIYRVILNVAQILRAWSRDTSLRNCFRQIFRYEINCCGMLWGRVKFRAETGTANWFGAISGENWNRRNIFDLFDFGG